MTIAANEDCPPEGVVILTSSTGSLAGPVTGSAWQPARPGQPRPLDADTLALVALPTSPFWARRYTRFFLDSCQGISAETAGTAELLVSELVTNAVRFAGDPARPSVSGAQHALSREEVPP
jgi:hypothetical protein